MPLPPPTPPTSFSRLLGKRQPIVGLAKRHLRLGNGGGGPGHICAVALRDRWIRAGSTSTSQSGRVQHLHPSQAGYGHQFDKDERGRQSSPSRDREGQTWAQQPRYRRAQTKTSSRSLQSEYCEKKKSLGRPLKDGPISFASSSSESGTIRLRRTTCTARAFCCNGFWSRPL